MKCLVSVAPQLLASFFSRFLPHSTSDVGYIQVLLIHRYTCERVIAYRASRSCRNFGRRYSARSGPFARQTVTPKSCQRDLVRVTQDEHGPRNARNGEVSEASGKVTDCALDVLGDILLDSELGHGLLGFKGLGVSDAWLVLCVPDDRLPKSPSARTNFNCLRLHVVGLFL